MGGREVYVYIYILFVLYMYICLYLYIYVDIYLYIYMFIDLFLCLYIQYVCLFTYRSEFQYRGPNIF